MASTVYFDGNWWEAIETTSPGQSPSSHPSKWRMLGIPDLMRQFAVQAAYAHLMADEGQNDKRVIELGVASKRLDEAWLKHGIQDGGPQSRRSTTYTR
jgi:hypothetical protein